MTRVVSHLLVRCVSGVVATLVAVGLTWGEDKAAPPNTEWRTYGGDLASRRYSPLDQIDATNFGKLEVAWRFSTDNLGPQPETNFQATPLMVDGVLYATGGSRRAVFALAAETGELLWMHRIDEGERGEAAPRRLSGRGLAYWRESSELARILYVTPGYQLFALDAETGRPVESFGKDGIVDLKRGLDQELDPVTGEVGLHAAPVVAGDVILIGAAHLPGGAPATKEKPKGYFRAFDARTGERLWIFHTIPQPGEFGHDTWLNDSWSYTGNTGVWAQVTVDEKLGIVYLPVEMPTGDYYGGHRPGDTLFSDSLVALDLRTGERKWHFQTVHHDVWDWDLPCAPILADIVVEGKAIQAIAQPTKQGFVFVFDRVTGEPVWPVEERPVRQTDVPGERTSPTQPFPTRPPPFDRQGVSVDDLIDWTPELREQAAEIVSSYRLGPIYTPPSLAQAEDGTRGTLMLPSATGGANWPGAALDPETSILYIYSKTQLTRLALENNPERSNMDYISASMRDAPPLNIDRLPIVKPPWGRITAIDLNRGEILWQIPHGETPDYIRAHPALDGISIPRTGQIGRIGTLVTKTLLIAGDGELFTTPTGVEGAMLRAYDKKTGDELGSVYMPGAQTGSPMTYAWNGTQYVVVAIGGQSTGGLIAFNLPEGGRGDAETPPGLH
ncbi:MAG TPA: pyrroloquinoline quinone-dependent dehydrogenase [Vicinamibacteria bacterium]|nr:pyrroloquinoline quinone-dependent dehydrogenase [Vicinamibacteria bacterium]